MKNKYIVLEKIEDLRFKGDHPNGVNKGYKLAGWCKEEPTQGKQLYLYPSKSIYSTPNAWTSSLVNIDLENNILETKNSKYKIDINEEKEDITYESLGKTLKKNN